MKKKILSIMLIMTMCFSLVACGGKNNDDKSSKETSEQSTEQQSEKSTEEETKQNTKLSKSEQVAFDFIEAIQKEDYKTVKDLLNVDTTYITEEDLEWLLPRTSYSDFVASEEEIKDITSNGGKTEDTIKLNVGPTASEVSVYLNDDNEWKVNCYELYTIDWEVKAPKGMSFKLNGTEVSKETIKSSDERWDIYAIPAAPIREMTLSFSSEKLGDFELKTTPGHGEYKAMLEFDEETANKIYEDIKTIMNDINAVYESGKTGSSDYAKFVSDYAAPDFINTLADSVKNQYTWNSGLHPRNIKVTQVLGRNDSDEYKPCFVYTENTIGVNLKIEKKWDEDYSDGSSNRIMGYFVIEKTEDGIKLVNMAASDNPIEERNSMTKDW